nr:hypothetical protein [uncultured Sellimonas sp.]
MTEKRRFSIIRFIGCGGEFYQSMDYEEGTVLSGYFDRSPRCGKDELFRWMKEAGQALLMLKKSEGGSLCDAVTPEAFLMTESRELFFLDSWPQRKTQNPAEVCGMLKGIGTIWKFMLEKSKPVPELTLGEIYRFSRMISICNKKQSKGYHSVKEEDILSELLKKIPNLKYEDN